MKLDRSEQTRQVAEDANVRNATIVKALLKEQEMRVKMLKEHQSSQQGCDTNAGEGTSRGEMERGRRPER